MNTNQLFAGAGAAPIRFPQELFPTDGFRGIHDDPSARVLVLQCGRQVAIACMELVMLPPDGIDRVKAIISEITHTDCANIWVHTTHVITTPHAPHAPMGMGGVPLEIGEEEKNSLEQKRALFDDAVVQAVTQAAKGAAASFRKAKMGVGAGECRVNVNRDVQTPYGWWINFAPEGPSNHTATVLQFEDEQGAPIAALISYGLKPCAIDNSELDAGTRLVSSDVPGLACRLLEQKLGAPCLFAMSAAGDQVPVEQAWYDVVEEDGTLSKVDIGVQAGLAIVDRLGRRMADELAVIFDSIVCDQAAPLIRLDQSCINWPGKAPAGKKLTKQAEYMPKGSQRVDAFAMVIGDVALVGVKPELNTVTEAQLQAKSPYPHTLIMSMVNGGQKYLPDLASYENSTWEAQSSAMMPGGAEAWVEEAASLLTRIHQSN